MFLNNAIYKYINNEVDASLIKRGAEIKKSGFVKDIQHFEKAKFYSSVVMDIFNVKVYYENAFRIIDIACNCSARKPCEHGTATLYQMLSMKLKIFILHAQHLVQCLSLIHI